MATWLQVSVIAVSAACFLAQWLDKPRRTLWLLLAFSVILASQMYDSWYRWTLSHDRRLLYWSVGSTVWLAILGGVALRNRHKSL